MKNTNEEEAMNQNKPVTNEERAESCLKGIRNSANSYNSDELIYFNKEASLQQIKYYLDNLQKEIEERFKSKLSANPNDWPEVKLQEKCDELEIKLSQREGEIQAPKEKFDDLPTIHIHILRNWSTEKTRAMALHLLGDDYQKMESRLSSHQALMEKVREILTEADRLYSSNGLKAAVPECGRWINSIREVLVQLNELREG